jgi:hypothetical protein
MLNQPGADAQFVLQELQFPADFMRSGHAFAEFLLHCVKALNRLLKPRQCLIHLLGYCVEHSETQRLDSVARPLNPQTYHGSNESSMIFEAVAGASTAYDPLAYDRASDSSFACRSGESAANDRKLFTNSER